MNKILLVEDDETVAIALTYTLKTNGYEVIHCCNVKSAMEKFLEDEFNLVLLDVMLPDGTGYDVCKFVRGRDGAIPVMFLTACDEEVNVVLGLDLGGDDYITKPFRINELLSRMNAVFRRRIRDGMYKSLHNESISIGNITVDKGKMKCYKDGEDLLLSTQEYKLIVLFIENRDHVLTRDQILARLWDDKGNFVEDNTLSVYIKRLREKIEVNSSKPKIIETVRGVGYKFKGDD
ncbi:MAG: response regulator transcription factor [Clostridium sp.]